MKKFLYIISMMIFVVSAAYAAEIPGAQVPLTITDPLTGQNLDCEKGDSWLGSFYGCEYPNARWCGYDSKWRDCSEGLCNEDYDGDDVVIKGYGTKDGNVWAWGASKSDPSDWHDVCWIKKDSALETLIKNQPDHSAKAKKNSNTNRIIADATAGVVLGTVSGLITSSVIKKNQIKNGFDDLECSSSGTKIADWGDEFMIRGAITKSECEAASGGRNNIFVWASKDSTGADYATLKEDTKTPDNNACWARADIISKDPNINTE
ncbi:MAG: hypothetical protein LBK26_04810, partial [Rickettsiales bacterium]|nr:hypothetical protein [Rickettsiales bacterium]